MSDWRNGLRASLATAKAPKAGKPVEALPEERETSALALDVALEGLRVQDARLNALAIELVARFGPSIVRRLVLEALHRKNRPRHRVRLLQTIGRIRPLLDAENIFDLWRLLADKNAAVRAAAFDLIDLLRLSATPERDRPVPPDTP